MRYWILKRGDGQFILSSAGDAEDAFFDLFLPVIVIDVRFVVRESSDLVINHLSGGEVGENHAVRMFGIVGVEGKLAEFTIFAALRRDDERIANLECAFGLVEAFHRSRTTFESIENVISVVDIEAGSFARDEVVIGGIVERHRVCIGRPLPVFRIGARGYDLHFKVFDQFVAFSFGVGL